MKMASSINRKKKINLLEYINRLNPDVVEQIRGSRKQFRQENWRVYIWEILKISVCHGRTGRS